MQKVLVFINETRYRAQHEWIGYAAKAVCYPREACDEAWGNNEIARSDMRAQGS